MERVCLHCGQTQIDNKLHYCQFCYKYFSEFGKNASSNEAKIKYKEKELLNNLNVSPTRKIDDSGKIFSINLKPLTQLIYDNIIKIFFFDLLLFISLSTFIFILGISSHFYKSNYYFITIFSFIIINIVFTLTKLTFTQKLLINESNNRYRLSNFFIKKEGKLSEFRSILVVKSFKEMHDNEGNIEYVITYWKLYLTLDDNSKIFLSTFKSSEDDRGKEAQGLAATWKYDYKKDDSNLIKAIESSQEQVEKSLLDALFWSNTPQGQEAKSLAMKIAKRLDLEVEKVNFN